MKKYHPKVEEFIHEYENGQGMPSELTKEVRELYDRNELIFEYDKRFVKPWLGYCMGWHVTFNVKREKFYIDNDYYYQDKYFDTLDELLQYYWNYPQDIMKTMTPVSY